MKDLVGKKQKKTRNPETVEIKTRNLETGNKNKQS